MTNSSFQFSELSELASQNNQALSPVIDWAFCFLTSCCCIFAALRAKLGGGIAIPFFKERELAPEIRTLR